MYVFRYFFIYRLASSVISLLRGFVCLFLYFVIYFFITFYVCMYVFLS